jgi:Fe2+ or Zn2+ uptake regulation protein
MNYLIKRKESLYKRLHDNGQRITKRKQIIIDLLLENTEYMLSVSQIMEVLLTGSMDTATVYRILQSFDEAGVVETSIDSCGITKYKICDSMPHHHLICTNCGKITNFPCSEKFMEKYIKENGFIEEYHKIEIYGKCRECSINTVD